MDVALNIDTVNRDFPAGTVDPGFTHRIFGNLADGTVFDDSLTNDQEDSTFVLEPGTYRGEVTKLGFTSLASEPFTVVAPTVVVLSVPDPARQATLSAV